MKLSEIDKEERKTIQNELESKSISLGMEAWESHGVNSKQQILKDLIGMCYNCKYLLYCRTEFGNVHAICSEFKFKLSGQNRITECNLHSPNNVLSLAEMYSIAYLINPDKDKKINGFVSNKNNMKK